MDLPIFNFFLSLNIPVSKYSNDGKRIVKSFNIYLSLVEGQSE